MRKIVKLVSTLLLIAAAFYLGTVYSDKRVLSENLIRLHVVADSDSAEDQAIKLQVHLPELEQVANDALRAAGNGCKAVVTLAKEAFPTREYDTFTLPAGIYESLRVTIGSGEGQNWWCVIFPSLCVSATTDGFEDTAAGAGFSDRLSGTLTGKQEYKVRFFLLDCFGWVENWIYGKGF